MSNENAEDLSSAGEESSDNPEFVEIELDENGRADLEVVEGSANVRSRMVLGGIITTIDGEPGESVTLAIRGDTDDF